MAKYLNISLVIKINAIAGSNTLQLLSLHSLHIGRQIFRINLGMVFGNYVSVQLKAPYGWE